MEVEWPAREWLALNAMTSLQCFRIRVILRDPEGSIPLSHVPHAALHHLRQLLSDVATWDELVFPSTTAYAAIVAATALPRDDCFEVRIVADCSLVNRSRFLADLCEVPARWRWSIQNYSVLRVVPWLEWGGEEIAEITTDEYETIHELWAGQTPFTIEHNLTARIYGNERRFRTTAEWTGSRLRWKDLASGLTYVFRDVATWVEAHIEKVRDIIDPDLVIAESVVLRKPY